MTDYDNYISLKLAGDDAYLSEKMVGYPAELDEVYTECFEEQKKEWFSCVGDGIQECRNTWEHKKWNITDLPEFELAITIDRPELYYDFLAGRDFCHDSWKNNFLEHHTLSKKESDRIYIGNQFCHNLLKGKIAVSGVESVGEQSCGDACLSHILGIICWKRLMNC